MEQENPGPDNEVAESTESARPAGLLYLQDWLDRPFWSFSAKSNLPQGFSQGSCLLCGVDPEETWLSDDQGYYWTLFPGTLESYGFERFPPLPDAHHLDVFLLRDLEACSGLPLSGPVRPLDAVRTAQDGGFVVPWYENAVKFGLIAESEPKSSTREVSIAARRDLGAHATIEKWKKDPKKILRKTLGKEIFDDLLSEGFLQCRAKNGRVKKSIIARTILDRLIPETKSDAELPAERTIVGDVTTWLEEEGVNLEDNAD